MHTELLAHYKGNSLGDCVQVRRVHLVYIQGTLLTKPTVGRFHTPFFQSFIAFPYWRRPSALTELAAVHHVD